MRDDALYILRLWCDGQERIWRASLEDLRTKHREVFANLETLHAFLDERTARDVAASNPKQEVPKKGEKDEITKKRNR